MPKAALRKRLLHQRREMPVAAVQSLGRRIQQRLLQSPLFLKAGVVALYHPIQNEVGTDLLLQSALRRGKTVLYPRVDGETMAMFRVASAADLKPGAYGIMEPHGNESVGLETIELMVIPGVGFDRNGGRLGFGKGFYDRLLASTPYPGLLVGLCYGFQCCDDLPTLDHDQPMHYVVTERELIAARDVAGGKLTARL